MKDLGLWMEGEWRRGVGRMFGEGRIGMGWDVKGGKYGK